MRLQIPRDGWMRFEVEDSGIGIPPDKMDRLFKSFSQVDDATQVKYGGTGLGLSICKQLVEMMGGTIGVQSESGRGSRFYFDVPWGELPEDAVDQGESGVWDAEAIVDLIILVVDDNLMNRRVITALLKHFGCAAEVAADGASACEKVEANDYDLVLMDLEMPDASGFDVTRKILELLPGTFVVAFTGHAESDVKQDCASAGMKGHLLKPVSPDRLKQLLARAAKEKSV